ncbi:tetratricopeptide repeat protein [Paenibacillus sp. 22594]|uniref:tetratricopeptide repeat protein n=1 Tax=Paenibacillus sp. 22594 TaxID=3453947 RepID=UPI003F846242
MNEFEKEISEAVRNYDIEKVETIIEQQLLAYPNNIDLLIRLAVAVLTIPLVDYPKSLACIHRIYEQDEKNVAATILECCVHYYHLAGIDEGLVRKINNIDVTNTYASSIKRLILSWRFAVTDKEKQVEMLRQAIALDPNNVKSYIQLGRIFINQGNVLEGRSLIKKALENIKLVYDKNTIFDFSDFNEYLNQKVRGIHLSNENKKSIERMLL